MSWQGDCKLPPAKCSALKSRVPEPDRDLSEEGLATGPEEAEEADYVLS